MVVGYNIIIAFLQVIITIVGIYFLARLKEDAKNESLLDHIADLTQKTEAVKRGFNENLERVRQELEVLANKRNVLFEESKNAIIEFLSNISNWFHDLNGGIFEYNLVNLESIDEQVQAIARDYQLVNNSSNGVLLIVDDHELIKASNDTVLALMEVHFYVDSSLKKLKRILSSEKHNLDQISSRGVDFWKQSGEMKDFILDRARSNEKEREDLHDEFPVKKHEMTLAAIKQRNVFIAIAKKFIIEGLT